MPYLNQRIIKYTPTDLHSLVSITDKNINTDSFQILSGLNIKNLEEEKNDIGEPDIKKDWFSIIFNFFFSTGIEINKEKET
jgi:hypothetical protein